MKSEINLLPQDLKHVRTARVYLAHSVQASRAVLIALVSVGLVLVGIGGAYRYLATSATQQMRDENSEAQALKAQVDLVNDRLAIVDSWRTSVHPWASQAAEVLASLPAGVTISHLIVQKEDDALEVRGVFDAREGLLTYQRSLEKLTWIKHIEAPLSNFQTGSEQTFTFVLERGDGSSSK